MMKKLKRLFLVSFIFGSVILSFILLTNLIVTYTAKGKTTSQVSNIKHRKVGMVLGTAKYLKGGNINLYFKYRIDAVVSLFENNKIDYILISGDNGNSNYDEPTDFFDSLVERGISSDKIFLDHAGFRTLDSVIRANKVFDQDDIIIISQKFHNERAIYLAEHHGIHAVGFNARDIHGKYGYKVKLREYFARSKAVLDIIFNVEPKFLGKKILIE